MTAAYRDTFGEQPFNDGFGSNSFGSNTPVWRALPEDDLILTGVRSFDIKALETRRYFKIDPANPDLPPQTAYVDLGYGNLADGLPIVNNVRSAQVPSDIPGYYWDLSEMLAHEGRIPPLPTDLRGDGYWTNIGQADPSLTNRIIRLRRVWDSWSTRYSSNRKKEVGGSVFAPNPPYGPQALPSYPAPYPAPLKGLQIQIRVVDPQNQRMRSLTIRLDFTDRL
jgi:hypothetical protein